MKPIAFTALAVILLSCVCYGGELPALTGEERKALYEAQQAYLEENFQGAAAILDKYLAGDPEQTPSYVFYQLHGSVAYLIGDLVGANRSFKSGLNLRPDDHSLCVNYAMTCYELKQYSVAAQWFEKAYLLKGTEGGSNEELLHQGAVCWFMGEEYGKAAELLKKLIAISSKRDANRVNMLIQSLVKQNKNKEAIDWLTGYLEKHPGEKDYWKVLAGLMIDLENLRGAAAALTVYVSMDGSDMAVLRQLAEFYRYLGAPLKAATLYERLLVQNPGETDTDILAELYITGGDNRKAEDTLVLITKKYPSADRYFRLGKFYFDGLKYGDAAGAFRVALEQDASHKDALIYLGYSLVETEEWSEAEVVFLNASKNKELKNTAVAYLKIVKTMLEPTIPEQKDSDS